ncbi:hypothetical protein D3C72_1936250 [compost metagenome]
MPLAGSYRLRPRLAASHTLPSGAAASASSALVDSLPWSSRCGTWRRKPLLFRLARLMPSVNEATHSMPARSCSMARKLLPGSEYGSLDWCWYWSKLAVSGFQRSRPADRLVAHSVCWRSM